MSEVPVNLERAVAVYTDAGVAKSGYTRCSAWAIRFIDEAGEVLHQDCGLLEMPLVDGVGGIIMEKIENNQAELYALIKGLRLLPDGWSGRVCCDNKNALGWMFHGFDTSILQPTWLTYMIKTNQRLGEVATVLHSGHPTKKELSDGFSKEGRPVSIHNHWCDKACVKLLTEWRVQHQGEEW